MFSLYTNYPLKKAEALDSQASNNGEKENKLRMLEIWNKIKML